MVIIYGEWICGFAFLWLEFICLMDEMKQV